MDKILTGHVCLVTGAGRGIGAAIAKEAARAGAAVALNYSVSLLETQRLQNEIEYNYKVPVMAVPADLGHAAAIDEMFAHIEAQLGAVDLLVNNAGVSLRALLIDTSDEQWEKVMNVNLRAPFLCCRRALPDMISRQFGRIVNISSVWGGKGAAYESVYAASKGGLATLTRSLAREVGGAGITVNAIAPGPVETDLLIDELDQQELRQLAEEIPLNRLGQAEDISAMCVYLLSPAGSYINGQIITVDGGWSA